MYVMKILNIMCLNRNKNTPDKNLGYFFIRFLNTNILSLTFRGSIFLRSSRTR